jgi:hypothetical protein
MHAGVYVYVLRIRPADQHCWCLKVGPEAAWRNNLLSIQFNEVMHAGVYVYVYDYDQLISTVVA